MSYSSSPFSPYLGALQLQFTLIPFYNFLSLSLMVLYQLESIHLDDYNLIYSQNKNKGFYKKFDSTSFKNPTFFFFTTIPQNQHGIYLNPHQKHLYWWFGTSYNQTLGKNPRIHTKVHQSIQNHKNMMDSMLFSYQLGFYPHSFNKSRVRMISQPKP